MAGYREYTELWRHKQPGSRASDVGLVQVMLKAVDNNGSMNLKESEGIAGDGPDSTDAGSTSTQVPVYQGRFIAESFADARIQPATMAMTFPDSKHHVIGNPEAGPGGSLAPSPYLGSMWEEHDEASGKVFRFYETERVQLNGRDQSVTLIRPNKEYVAAASHHS